MELNAGVNPLSLGWGFGLSGSGVIHLLRDSVLRVQLLRQSRKENEGAEKERRIEAEDQAFGRPDLVDVGGG